MTTLSFVHRYEPATVAGSPPVLLLHGTGGDENDLIELGRTVAPGATLLSPRGKVLEHGMPRFFRRLAEGVFDEDDLRIQTHALAGFIDEARMAYGIEAPVALGYSNGANIAAALLLLKPQALAGAVLLRAMTPLRQPPQPVPSSLSGKRILIASGLADPIMPVSNAALLAQQLRSAGATVDHQTLPAGHGLSNADITLAKAFLQDTQKAAA